VHVRIRGTVHFKAYEEPSLFSKSWGRGVWRTTNRQQSIAERKSPFVNFFSCSCILEVVDDSRVNLIGLFFTAFV
jgi:hypothetical protein